MKNIALSVESEVIKKVRKIAIDRDTTLTALVMDFLRSIAGRVTCNKKKGVRNFHAVLQRYGKAYLEN